MSTFIGFHTEFWSEEFEVWLVHCHSQGVKDAIKFAQHMSKTDMEYPLWRATDQHRNPLAIYDRGEVMPKEAA